MRPNRPWAPPLRSRSTRRVHLIKTGQPAIEHVGRKAETHGTPGSRGYEQSAIEKRRDGFPSAALFVSGNLLRLERCCRACRFLVAFRKNLSEGGVPLPRRLHRSRFA